MRTFLWELLKAAGSLSRTLHGSRETMKLCSLWPQRQKVTSLAKTQRGMNSLKSCYWQVSNLESYHMQSKLTKRHQMHVVQLSRLLLYVTIHPAVVQLTLYVVYTFSAYILSHFHLKHVHCEMSIQWMPIFISQCTCLSNPQTKPRMVRHGAHDKISL